jgi:hypothetical protein
MNIDYSKASKEVEIARRSLKEKFPRIVDPTEALQGKYIKDGLLIDSMQ